MWEYFLKGIACGNCTYATNIVYKVIRLERVYAGVYLLMVHEQLAGSDMGHYSSWKEIRLIPINKYTLPGDIG